MMDLLKEVKNQLGITIDDGDIDYNLTTKIEAVKEYLIEGGASIPSNVSPRISACIAIGVNDLLNSKAGGTDFSPAFHMLARQICRG